MADEHQSDSQKEFPNGEPLILETRVERLEREERDQRNRDNEYKQQQTTINRRLATFTGLLVLTSVISDGIFIYQSKVFRKAAKAAKTSADIADATLKEVQKSSTDTHALAVAAGKQADAAKTQSEQAIAQTKKLEESLRKTDKLIIESTNQASATNELASAAKRSAAASEAANKQTAGLFGLQNRPWVGISSEVVLENLSTENSIFKLKLSYRLKNFGLSPASNTITWLNFTSEEQNLPAIEAKINGACESAERNVLPMRTGDLLLPSAEKPDTWSFTDRKIWTGKFLVPGCIIYRDTAGIIHHTRVCYWIDLSANPMTKTFGTCWFQSAD